jgi:cytochrome P450
MGFDHEGNGPSGNHLIMGAVTNTVPNAFYMICRICSRPNLVNAFRAEVGRISTRETRDGVDVVTLNIAMLQTHCPLLVACFNETMRLTKIGASVRIILKDVMLNDQYLLKKGSFLQNPTGALQSDPKI